MAGEITLAQFEVYVQDLHEAIGTVQTAADAIDADCQTVKDSFGAVEAAWSSPAGTTFAEMTTIVGTVMDELTSLLQDTVSRMRTTYANYLDVERQNTKNVSN